MAEPGSIKTQSVGVSASATERAVQPKTIDAKAFNRAINKATNQTDWNDHNGSIRTITKFFKYDDLTKKMDGIIATHEDLGHMPQNLMEERRKVMNDLYDRVERDYGKEIRKKVYNAL